MGLTGEGYRTGGVALIKSSLIALPGSWDATPEEIAEAQLALERDERLPLFHVGWVKGSSKPYKLHDSGEALSFVAACKLGYTFVKCLVDGEADPDLQMMERVDDAS